jgi:hypothetical protein
MCNQSRKIGDKRVVALNERAERFGRSAVTKLRKRDERSSKNGLSLIQRAVVCAFAEALVVAAVAGEKATPTSAPCSLRICAMTTCARRVSST